MYSKRQGLRCFLPTQESKENELGIGPGTSPVLLALGCSLTYRDYAMKRLKIVLIGDMHFPDNELFVLQDRKDIAFPESLSERIAPKPLQNVIRSIKKQEGVHAFLMSGDLTSHGDLDGYRRCVKYIKDAKLSRSEDGSPADFCVVPGNHDIDGAARDESGTDLYMKFKPLKEAWAEHALDVLPCETLRAYP